MDPSELRQRKGSFLIKRSMIDRNLPFIQKIMAQVVVIRCEHLWIIDAFNYHALSPLFDLCPEGDIPHDYVFSQDEGLNLVCTKTEDRLSE